MLSERAGIPAQLCSGSESCRHTPTGATGESMNDVKMHSERLSASTQKEHLKPAYSVGMEFPLEIRRKLQPFSSLRTRAL